MLMVDKIQRYVRQLPEPLQAEVLDFVEYLVLKAEREALQQEDSAWSELSLQMAMRGMEDEDTPEYTLSDLKVTFDR